MPKIKKSVFAKSIRAQQDGNKHDIPNQSLNFNRQQYSNYIESTVFSVFLDDGSVITIDLSKRTNYRFKNGYLYKGLFKKIAKIKIIRIYR